MNEHLTLAQQRLVQLFDEIRGRPMAEPEPSQFMTHEAASVVLPVKLTKEQKEQEMERV